MVALPFFMFVLGIIGVGLYYFTSNALEHGVESASRKVLTGEAQKGDLTVEQFRQLICSEAGSYINCDKLHVLVQSAANWGDITPQSCVADNKMVPSTGTSGDLLSKYSGAAKTVVSITACYQWDLAEMFAFLKLGTGADGSGPAVVQASTAFRSEPYS